MTNPSAGSMRKQRGAVLYVAIVALVITTLAGISLTGSVDTATTIAGNLAFQQATTLSAENGVEAAAEWIQEQANAVPNPLQSNQLQFPAATAPFYIADGGAPAWNPAAGQSWNDFWINTWGANQAGRARPVRFDCDTRLPDQAGACNQDSAGNTMSYVVQRLCTLPGDPTPVFCVCPPQFQSGAQAGNSMGGVAFKPEICIGVYYRVIVHIEGPHNALNYVEPFVIAQ